MANAHQDSRFGKRRRLISNSFALNCCPNSKEELSEPLPQERPTDRVRWCALLQRRETLLEISICAASPLKGSQELALQAQFSTDATAAVQCGGCLPHCNVSL